MRARDLHRWDLSPKQAVILQKAFRRRIRLRPLPGGARLVVGADVGYAKAVRRMYAAVVVLALPGLEVVDRATAVVPETWPYVPGLFSFRELPPLIEAFARLSVVPDVLMFDGQGIAHPRRFGLASHAGLIFSKPSLGCAKTRLAGEHRDPGVRRGARADLVLDGEVVGAVLRTRHGVKPVFVSPGHRCDVDSAVALAMATTRGYRLPEPVRLAHQATAALMREDVLR